MVQVCQHVSEMWWGVDYDMVPLLTIETIESNVKATQKQCKNDTEVHFTEELLAYGSACK